MSLTQADIWLSTSLPPVYPRTQCLTTVYQTLQARVFHLDPRSLLFVVVVVVVVLWSNYHFVRSFYDGFGLGLLVLVFGWFDALVRW